MLADQALALENDVEEVKPGVAEIQVSESEKLVGLLEDLSRRLEKLETATATAAKKKNYGRSHTDENRASKTPFVRNVQAKPSVLVNCQGFFTNVQQASRPYVPPLTLKQNTVQSTDTVNAPTTKLSVIRRVCAVNLVRTTK